MNERIQELAEQAKKYAIDKLDETGELHKYYDVYFEKFAELIVQECINILPEKVKIDDLYDGKILVQCGMAIKEHFGVEE